MGEDLPTKSVPSKDPWNAPLRDMVSKEETGTKYDIEDPWIHPDNHQKQEPYLYKKVGFFEINTTPPWTQPVKKFSVDETLLTHAAPAGFPPLPDVQLRQLPAYLARVKWTHVPDNIVYWYCLTRCFRRRKWNIMACYPFYDGYYICRMVVA